VNQRVFETTFYIDASDVLDGSEKSFYLPSVFTDNCFYMLALASRRETAKQIEGIK
jgi:hypothetical protein